MRFVAYASLCFLIAGLACGQKGDPAKDRLEKSPRHHEWVTVKTETGRQVKVWVVYPEVDEPKTAVVVIHENRGLNDWARSAADQVAEAGYVALAPDLLSGTGKNGGGTDSYPSSDAARTAIYKLSEKQVMQDLDAVVAHARKMKATTDTVVVGGFCWGGGKTFAYATHNPDIDAAFVFYGSAPDSEELKKIKAPVYGFYGGDDFRITGKVPDVKKTMKKLGKKYEPVIYEGAGHGFMRSGEAADAKKANRQAREQAWKRWKKLLGEISASD